MDFMCLIVFLFLLLIMLHFFFLNFFGVMSYDTLRIFSTYSPYEDHVFEDYESKALFSFNIQGKVSNCSSFGLANGTFIYKNI